jgi:hypothetical protein
MDAALDADVDLRELYVRYEYQVHTYEQRDLSRINSDDYKLYLLCRFLRNFMSHYQDKILGYDDNDTKEIRNLIGSLCMQIFAHTLCDLKYNPIVTKAVNSNECAHVTEIVRFICGVLNIKKLDHYFPILRFPAEFIDPRHFLSYEEEWTWWKEWKAHKSIRNLSNDPENPVCFQIDLSKISVQMKNCMREAVKHYAQNRKDKNIDLAVAKN